MTRRKSHLRTGRDARLPYVSPAVFYDATEGLSGPEAMRDAVARESPPFGTAKDYAGQLMYFILHGVVGDLLVQGVVWHPRLEKLAGRLAGRYPKTWLSDLKCVLEKAASEPFPLPPG